MTPKSRGMIENADQSDPVVQQFRKADLNNDGKLSQYEVKRMMIKQLGYDVDGTYVTSLMEKFGDFDLDSDGAISLDEFEALFTHLGGMERVEAVAKQRDLAADPLMSKFRMYDSGEKGHLTEDDVTRLMTDFGYSATESYVDGLVQVHGSFDTDGNGTIEWDEFPALWEHLG